MNPMPAYLFDLPGIDQNPPPPGPRRCGRVKKTDGGKCMSYPGSDKPACPHHIRAAELALVEERQRIRAAA